MSGTYAPQLCPVKPATSAKELSGASIDNAKNTAAPSTPAALNSPVTPNGNPETHGQTHTRVPATTNPPEAPNATPGVSVPPYDPCRKAATTSTPLATNNPSVYNKAGTVNDPTSSARLNVCCTSARPLPITSGSTIDTTPTAANTSGTRHSTLRFVTLPRCAHPRSRRNHKAPGANTTPSSTANASDSQHVCTSTTGYVA